jgi:hypothetical protein
VKRLVRDLTKARSLLVEEGWQQFGYFERRDGTGSMCVFGSFLRVVGANSYWDATLRGRLKKMKEAVCGVAKIPIGQLAVWNDDPKRTKRQVLNVLDRAIKKASET